MSSEPSTPPPTASALTAAGNLVRLFRLAAGCAALIVIAALMFAPSFWPLVTRLDHWTADWRTAYLSYRPPTQNGRIAVVAITDETLRNFASSPIDRGLLADIIGAVDHAGAAVIGLDILFLKPTEPTKDERLVEAIRRARAPVVLGALDARGELLQFQREFQAAYLSRMDRPAGFLNTRHENDDVVRFTAGPGPGPAYRKSFARLIAEAAGAERGDDVSRPIPWQLPAATGSPAFLTVAAEKLLADAAGPEASALKGRVVLVGGVFPFRDRHRVPLTVRTHEELAGVYIHATTVAGLLDPDRTIAEISPLAVRGVIAMLAAVGLAMGLALWHSTLIATMGHGIVVVVLLAVDAICFTQFSLLLPFTLAVTAWVAGLTAGRSFGAVFGAKIGLGRFVS